MHVSAYNHLVQSLSCMFFFFNPKALWSMIMSNYMDDPFDNLHQVLHILSGLLVACGVFLLFCENSINILLCCKGL